MAPTREAGQHLQGVRRMARLAQNVALQGHHRIRRQNQGAGAGGGVEAAFHRQGLGLRCAAGVGLGFFVGFGTWLHACGAGHDKGQAPFRKELPPSGRGRGQNQFQARRKPEQRGAVRADVRFRHGCGRERPCHGAYAPPG